MQTIIAILSHLCHGQLTGKAILYNCLGGVACIAVILAWFIVIYCGPGWDY